MKIIIVGAGPVGSYAAFRLSDLGHEVHVYEEHEKIGEPVSCTGIITGTLADIIDISDEYVVNKIKKIEINSKNHKFELKLEKEEIIVNRTIFDIHLLKKAKKKGAKIHTGKRFIGLGSNNKAIFISKSIKNSNEIKEKTTIGFDLLIGADGPNSKVREIINGKEKTSKLNNYIGYQAVMSWTNQNEGYLGKGTVKVFLGEKYKNFFGWIVPEIKGYARVGSALMKNPKAVVESLIEESKGKIIEKQGGLIPVYCSKLTVVKDNIAIIGDAATHVKATTGGGIIPGIRGAREIIQIIQKEIKKKDKDKRGLIIKNNELKINKEMKHHLFIRKMLNCFNDKDYNKLVKLCNKKVRKILENKSRDNLASFSMKIIYAQPKFLFFSKKIFKMLFNSLKQ